MSTRSAVACALFTSLAGPLLAQTQEPIDSFWVTNGDVNAITVSPGTVYLGGNFTWVGRYNGACVRVDAATGAVDTPDLRVNGTVYAVAPDGAGGFFIGGNFTKVNGAARNRLAHVLADGRLSAWNPGVSGSNNVVRALAAGDGRVYVGGEFSTLAGTARNNIGAVSAVTGAVISTWNPGGGGTDFVYTLSLVGSTLYVGGSFFTMGGQSRSYAAALNATTGAATTWNPGANQAVYSIAVTPTTAYVGGNFTFIGGQSRSYIAALNLTTGAASAWNPAADTQVRSVAVSGNTVYAGGLFSTIGGQSRRGLAALNALVNVNNATGWDPIGAAASTSVFAVAEANGVVYAGGDMTAVQGVARSNLAAIDAVSGAATAWNPGASSRVWALKVSSGKVFLGGDLGGVGGTARTRLAAFDRATGAATSWAPGANGVVNALAFAGGRVHVGGSFSQVGGVARGNLAAVDTAGTTVAAWTANTDTSVLALGADANSLYVGGVFTLLGGQPRNRIGAASLAAGGATAWNPGPASTDVRAFLLSGSTAFVGGTFNSLGGQPRNNVAAIDTTLATALAFNPNANSQLYALALDGGTLYLGGNFTTITAQPRNRIAAVDAATGTFSPWNPNASAQVWSLAAASGTVFAGGDFTTIGGQTRNRLAALDSATGLATSWNPGASARVSALVASSNQLFVGGAFVALGDGWRRGFGAFCLVPPASGLTVSSLGANTVSLVWAGGASAYRVYRSRSSGYGYELVGTAAGPAFSDTTAEGGVTYYYVVRAFDQCESDPSNEVSATAPGSCTLPPDFEGLGAAVPSAVATCTVDLSWAAAAVPCGGAASYSVHRDVSPLVVPSASNLVATLSGTSLSDSASLSPSTTYYYVVRATDVANGETDANLIRHPATTSGGCTASATPRPVFLAATAGETQVELQWRNPPGFGSVVIHRNLKPAGPCLFPSDPNPAASTFVAPHAGPVGGNDAYVDTGLSNGVSYCYSVFVDNGGSYSAAKSVEARPFTTSTGPVKWAYSTGASSMAPPGIGSAGVIVASNDRALHGLERGPGGGTWAPGFTPLLLGDPAQQRPAVVPSPVIPPASQFTLVGSQDGYAYAVDAQTGAQLWKSAAKLGDLVQAAPMGMFAAFGGPHDLVLVGSRNSSGTGVFYALAPATGATVASFDNGGGASSIGIVSSGAAVDYATSRVVFASRAGGSGNTLWSLNVGAASLTLHWAIPLGDIDGSPVLRNGRIYVGSNDGRVWAVNAATGALEWASPFVTNDGPVKGFVFPDRTNGDLYFATDTKVWGITDQGASAAALWAPVTLPGAGTTPSTVLKVPGASWLYVGGSDGRLHQLDLSGATPVHAAVTLGDGLGAIGAPTLDIGWTPRLIYVGGEGGFVYAVETPF